MPCCVDRRSRRGDTRPRGLVTGRVSRTRLAVSLALCFMAGTKRGESTDLRQHAKRGLRPSWLVPFGLSWADGLLSPLLRATDSTVANRLSAITALKKLSLCSRR